MLIHWGLVMHICVSKQPIIGSDNGLSSGWCQAIIWTNAGILLIGPLGTQFNEILIKIYTSSFKKMHLKMSGKWQPFCLSLNVLTHRDYCATLHKPISIIVHNICLGRRTVEKNDQTWLLIGCHLCSYKPIRSYVKKPLFSNMDLNIIISFNNTCPLFLNWIRSYFWCS